jgi:molybdopterin synthase sulfur carrier subunit
MKVTIIIPAVLQQYTGNNRVLTIEGNTAGEVLDNLTIRFFPLRKQIFSDFGKIKNHINIYLNDTDIKLLEADNLPLNVNDVIKIIPTITGGFKGV